MNCAVVYKSIYGTTKQYAQWIAEELGASLFDTSSIKPAQLMEYDVVIFGGGLYAGGIAGAKLVAKNPCKTLVVFTVGLATPEITDYTDIVERNFSKELLAKIKLFHFQGGIDYGKLSVVHKAMMAVKKREVEKTNPAERSSDDPLFLETYGNKINFTNRVTIAPLVEYIRTL